MAEVIMAPLSRLLYYLCLAPRPEEGQQKERRLQEARERERVARERRRIEGERRWKSVIDGWLKDMGMEEEAGCVGEDVE
jgi:hypothetical protein